MATALPAPRILAHAVDRSQRDCGVHGPRFRGRAEIGSMSCGCEVTASVAAGLFTVGSDELTGPAASGPGNRNACCRWKQ